MNYSLYDLRDKVEDVLATMPADSTQGANALKRLQAMTAKTEAVPDAATQGEWLACLLILAARSGVTAKQLLEGAETMLTKLQPARKTALKPFPAQPLATSVSDLATPKQIGLIRALAREMEIDLDAELLSICNTDAKVEELSRAAASIFIENLKTTQEGA